MRRNTPSTKEREVSDARLATVSPLDAVRLDTNGNPVFPAGDALAELEAALQEAEEAVEEKPEEAPVSTTDKSEETRETVALSAEFASLALSARFSPNSRHYIRGGHQARCVLDRDTGRYLVEIHRRTPAGHVRTWVEIPETLELFVASNPKEKTDA